MASAKTEDKRRRIVEAATALFGRYGFKRTSVDLLAAEASVAKPTIYNHFADKDAIFLAVVEQVCADLLAATERERETDRPIEERLAGMLSAKFTRGYEIAHTLPHGPELMDAKSALGIEVVQRTERAFLRLLTAAIDESDAVDPRRVGLTATSAAALFFRAASGAAIDATSAASHRKHLSEIVRVIVLAMRIHAT